ncbi:MAG TPA: diacylglycerol kinase family lipid kinase [Bacteroidales bacterium]|nr:diacylglycerol kinase family lipid kinase [Bacteroidales bacterium]HRX96542.1 diacylglycerol kinase family lipid kinase [Bacteroidales bacterium]
MKQIVFIVNPNSGIFSKDNIHEVISAHLDKNRFEYQVRYTEGPGHATELSKEWAGKGADVVVAVGGDGSVNEVARGLVFSTTSLGIIPAGSGNGLAHHLKIPLIRKKAIEVINIGNTKQIDTACMNEHLFVSIAGIGFDGKVARKFSQEGFRGFVAYLKVVTELYPGYKPKKYEIELNGQKIVTKALFVAFANSDQFGFQTSIAPNAKIDDGLIDVAIVKKPQLIEIPFLAGLLFWRKIDKSNHIQIFKTDDVLVKTKKNRWANLDGEPIKAGKELHVKVNPNSLNVIIP